MRPLSLDPSCLDRRGHPAYRLLRGVHDPLVRRFERASGDPERAQRALLASILRGVSGTAFSRDHGLDRVSSLEELRARLPVAGFERVAPYVQRAAAGERRVLTRQPVIHLLETSGTTGPAKWIPVTKAWARGVSDAQTLWLLGLVREHPALAEGAALTLISPAAKGHSPGGIPFGSNTGRMHLAQPWWVRRRYPVPYEAYCLPDPELRLYAVLRFALQADVRSITTANPTTVLLIARKLEEHAEALSADLEGGCLRHGPAAALTPALRAPLEARLRRVRVPRTWRPAQLWSLAVVSCWKGGLASWFLPRLPTALGAHVPVREVGISASETFIGVPLTGSQDGCVAWPLGELLEFVPDDGRPRGLWQLDQGAEYRVVISGHHGLLRYDLGDVVRVVGRYRQTPVLVFVRRHGNQLSATGEKLTETQLLAAMADCAVQQGVQGAPFTLRLVMAERPWYELAIEAEPVDEEALAMALDAQLQAHNVEYASKRRSGRLDPPRVRTLPAGSYALLRRRAVLAGTPEGQYKHPAMVTAEATWQALERAAQDQLGSP
jgi:hypothetical protein